MSGRDKLRLQERRVEEDGKGGRRVRESILLGSCPSPREQEAETQLDRIDEEIPKNSALNFQRSLKHKRVLTLSLFVEMFRSTSQVNTNPAHTVCVESQRLIIFNSQVLMRCSC